MEFLISSFIVAFSMQDLTVNDSFSSQVELREHGIQENFYQGHDRDAVQSFAEALARGEDAELGILSSQEFDRNMKEWFESFELGAFWDHEDWFLSYGKNIEDELIIVAWAKHGRTESLSLEELCRRYLEEKLGEVQDSVSMEIWKRERAHLLGAFIQLRKNKIESQSYSLKLSGPVQVEADQVGVTEQPLVLRFESRPPVAAKSPVLSRSKDYSALN